MKITVGMIVLNGDFLLWQVLESLYPYVDCICIAEGPVEWWVKQGVLHSNERTMEILDSFPDPGNKIRITHGTFQEKDQQCQVMFNMVPTDTDYLFCVDHDEIHTPQNLLKLRDMLERKKPATVGFKSDTLFGGFDYVMGGFERDHSFKRILRYIPGCFYLTHRQPTLATMTGPGNTPLEVDKQGGENISGNELYEMTGITMWHGSYISPQGVYDKIRYYESAVIAPGKCIKNYFHNVWLPWVMEPGKRAEIEKTYLGVHEFLPSVRGAAFTEKYAGQHGSHPPVIRKHLPSLQKQFQDELNRFI